MPSRRVRQVIHPQPVLEGACRVRRSFPSYLLDYPDPFLLFDHFTYTSPSDCQAGFPLHPHRGLETITYVLAGEWAYQDHLGQSGALPAGSVQWLTAGSGVLHAEMPHPGPTPGRLEAFQLWLNLPGYLKMTRPAVQEFTASQIPELTYPDEVRIKVLAGELGETLGPVVGIAGDPCLLDVSVPPGGEVVLPAPSGYTCLAYLYRGQARFGPPPTEEEEDAEIIAAQPLGYSLAPRQPFGAVTAPLLVTFEEGGLVAAHAAVEEARFLLMLNLPLHEPVARHGSIAMSTPEELEESLRDYYHGLFIRPE